MTAILTEDQVLTCIAIINSHSARAAIQAAAGLGAELEREACAKVCDRLGDEIEARPDSVDATHCVQIDQCGTCAAAILSDDDKQRLTEQFGACNWQLLDAAYQKGMEAAACICEAWAEQHRIDAQETVDENCDFRIAAEDCAAAIRSALATASTERSE